MSLREDAILRGDRPGIYSVVDKDPFAIVIPIDGDMIRLVRQFRYPVQREYWELPQGNIEGEPNATPEEIANRELGEETGRVADKMTYLGLLYPAYGLLSQEMHVFLAEGLKQAEGFSLDEGEHDLISEDFPISSLDSMIDSGAIRDGCTLAALYLWNRKRA